MTLAIPHGVNTASSVLGIAGFPRSLKEHNIERFVRKNGTQRPANETSQLVPTSLNPVRGREHGASFLGNVLDVGQKHPVSLTRAPCAAGMTFGELLFPPASRHIPNAKSVPAAALATRVPSFRFLRLKGVCHAEP